MYFFINFCAVFDTLIITGSLN